MKTALFLFLTIICISANAQKKQTGDFYGTFFVGLEVKNAKPSGGMVLGYAFKNVVGIGIGGDVVAIKSLQQNSSKAGATTFGEIRFIVPSKNIRPSFAFQMGKFNYSDSYTASSSSSIVQSTVSGKTFTGANIIFTFLKKDKQQGLFVGYNFRSVNIEANAKATTWYVNNGQLITNHATSKVSSNGNYHVIIIGFNF